MTVNEMQDASHARSRLIRALVSGPDRYLFAVGDDWQSINRFAGADLSAMTAFHDWFGSGPVRLQQTFRSPQSICDVTSRFVTANPAQLRKQVRSTRPEYPPTLRAGAVEHPREIADVLDRHLKTLSAGITDGSGHPSLGRIRGIVVSSVRMPHRSRRVGASRAATRRIGAVFAIQVLAASSAGCPVSRATDGPDA